MAKESLKNLGVSFSKSKQVRAEQSLVNLMEAAEKIVNEGDVAGFNARNLAKVSGYSLGSLIQRLGKVENIFLHAIAYGRSRHIASLAEQIENFGNEKTAAQFCEQIVDLSLGRMAVVGAPVIRYYESRAMGRTNNVGNIYAYTDEIIPTLQKIMNLNTTGTFRVISNYEMKYVARFIFQILERPLAENDLLAGTEQHREMAINILSSLLCAS